MKIAPQQFTELMKTTLDNTISRFEQSLDNQDIKKEDIDTIYKNVFDYINKKSKELVKNKNEFTQPSVTLLIGMKLFLAYSEIYDKFLDIGSKELGITRQQLDEEVRIHNDSKLAKEK